MSGNEEFAKLGQAIGDAINRLPQGYEISIHLERNDRRVVLKYPGEVQIDGSINGTLAYVIAKAVDAAVEDSKRRGE